MLPSVRRPVRVASPRPPWHRPLTLEIQASASNDRVRNAIVARPVLFGLLALAAAVGGEQ